MATWPASLGKPLREGYSAVSEPRVLYTTMSSGPKRRALMSNHDVTTGSVSFIWDDQQKRDYETFFNVTARKGTIPVAGFPLDLVDGVADHLTWLFPPSQIVVAPAKTWRVTFGFETEQRNAV